MMTKDAFTKKYSVGDWVFNRFGEAAYYILKIGKNKVEYFHENSNSIAKPSFNNFYDHEDEILCNQPINEGLSGITEPIDPRIEKRLTKIEELLNMNELEKEVVELISNDLRNATGVLTGDGIEFEYSYPWDEQTWFKDEHTPTNDQHIWSNLIFAFYPHEGKPNPKKYIIRRNRA